MDVCLTFNRSYVQVVGSLIMSIIFNTKEKSLYYFYINPVLRNY